MDSPRRSPRNPPPVSILSDLPEKPPTPAITNWAHGEDEIPLSPVAIVNRLSREETVVAVTKVEGDRGSKVVEGIIGRSNREELVGKAGFGFRVCGMLFCLLSFAVMASDKTQGWAGDSFDRYKEYRYCLSVTVIGFVYSGFQAYGQVHHFITGKHIIRRTFRYYFDFSMDQILAYLLMSASSSAATRTDDWVSDWGEDEFNKRKIDTWQIYSPFMYRDCVIVL
ncbi:CASP-like protein 4A3 isoform X2 [Tasmannia lanceolata]|uniref:CASP-like protein 4A3 isoform X2 n=1 Tax=Tasmannia lanceolata TaxID=3420 RepID=UPI00406361D6